VFWMPSERRHSKFERPKSFHLLTMPEGIPSLNGVVPCMVCLARSPRRPYRRMVSLVFRWDSLGFGRFPVCFGRHVNGIQILKDQNHSDFSQCWRVYLRSMGCFRVCCVRYPWPVYGVSVIGWEVWMATVSSDFQWNLHVVVCV
jgi:hypothetical protein